MPTRQWSKYHFLLHVLFGVRLSLVGSMALTAKHVSVTITTENRQPWSIEF